MMPPARIDPERVVAEVPDLAHAAPPWTWFELDLDHISDDQLRIGPPPRLDRAVRVSGMTRSHQPHKLARHLARVSGTALTHLQFEVHRARSAATGATLVREAGLAPLPATHLHRAPTTQALLQRTLEVLAGLGAPLVKLAYPAPDALRLLWGIDLFNGLADRHPGIELALVPMGTAGGRAAAFAAGSRLIWAPPQADGQRWAADQLLPVAAPPTAGWP